MASAAADISVIDTPDMPAIKKAVPTKPPLSGWPEAFTKRRATLKRGIVKLTSGRSVGYTDDCSSDDSFTVVCFHGFCQEMILRAPIPNPDPNPSPNPNCMWRVSICGSQKQKWKVCVSLVSIVSATEILRAMVPVIHQLVGTRCTRRVIF